MANPTAGFGLRAVRRLDGAAMSFQIEENQIAYNNSHTWGTGDLVIRLSTGYIDAYVASGAVVLGVFMGCSYFSAPVGRTIWSPIWNAPSLASNLLVKAWIMTDPNIVYDIRGDATAAITNAAVGANADVVVGTPNAITGQSTTLLNTTTMDSTATFPLRIVGLASFPNIDNTLSGDIAQVVLNTQVYKSNTGI